MPSGLTCGLPFPHPTPTFTCTSPGAKPSPPLAGLGVASPPSSLMLTPQAFTHAMLLSLTVRPLGA